VHNENDPKTIRSMPAMPECASLGGFSMVDNNGPAMSCRKCSMLEASGCDFTGDPTADNVSSARSHRNRQYLRQARSLTADTKNRGRHDLMASCQSNQASYRRLGQLVVKSHGLKAVPPIRLDMSFSPKWPIPNASNRRILDRLEQAIQDTIVIQLKRRTKNAQRQFINFLSR
jgi:hypothetical protein